MIKRWFFVYYLSMALSIVAMHEKKNQFYILKEKIIRRITEIFNMIKCSLDHRLDYNMYCQVIVQFIDNLEVYQYILSLMWTILYFFLVKQKFGDNNKDSEVFVVAPSTSPLNPVLVERFSGKIKKKFLNKIIFCTLHKA